MPQRMIRFPRRAAWWATAGKTQLTPARSLTAIKSGEKHRLARRRPCMTLSDAVISAMDALRLHKLRSALPAGHCHRRRRGHRHGGGRWRAREQVVAQIRSLGANLLRYPRQCHPRRRALGSGAASTLTDDERRRNRARVPGVRRRRRSRVRRAAYCQRANWPPRSTASISAGSRRANGRSSPAGIRAGEISARRAVALIGRRSRTLYGGLDPSDRNCASATCVQRRRRDG